MKSEIMELNTIRYILKRQQPVNPSDFNFLTALFKGRIITTEMSHSIDFYTLSEAHFKFAKVVAEFRDRSIEVNWVEEIKSRVELTPFELECLDMWCDNEIAILVISRDDTVLRCPWNTEFSKHSKVTKVKPLKLFIQDVVEEYAAWVDKDQVEPEEDDRVLH